MISILCPTRGRPESFAAMVDSAYRNADNPGELEVRAYLDDDDPQRSRYITAPTFGVFLFTCGPRLVLSEAWNQCYEDARGDIFMHGADDIRFRTRGWDTIVEQTFKHFPDRIALIHGDDGGDHPQDLATHGFLHRRWVDAVGHFLPPYFDSDMNDVWLTAVADELGRRVLVPIVTEHMHPNWQKGEIDVTHRERMDRHAVQRPDLLYDDLAGTRAADVAKLRAVMA